jgi:hypothetical protein
VNIVGLITWLCPSRSVIEKELSPINRLPIEVFQKMIKDSMSVREMVMYRGVCKQWKESIDAYLERQKPIINGRMARLADTVGRILRGWEWRSPMYRHFFGRLSFYLIYDDLKTPLPLAPRDRSPVLKPTKEHLTVNSQEELLQTVTKIFDKTAYRQRTAIHFQSANDADAMIKIYFELSKCSFRNQTILFSPVKYDEDEYYSARPLDSMVGRYEEVIKLRIPQFYQIFDSVIQTYIITGREKAGYYYDRKRPLYDIQTFDGASGYYCAVCIGTDPCLERAITKIAVKSIVGSSL